VILDGPHAGLVQVLGKRATVTIPTIVRNIDENLSSATGEQANLIGENGFVTDEHSEAVISDGERLTRSTMGEFAHFASQASGEAKYGWEGKVLAEGDQVDFVISRNQFAVGVNEYRRVVHPRSLAALRCGISAEAASHT